MVGAFQEGAGFEGRWGGGCHRSLASVGGWALPMWSSAELQARVPCLPRAELGKKL